jgi:hypothetical protein
MRCRVETVAFMLTPLGVEQSKTTSERQGNPRPERKPGEAGLRGGELMRRGDAQPRRTARLITIADHP